MILLDELNQCIFDLTKFLMHNVIDILLDSKSRDFGLNAGKETY